MPTKHGAYGTLTTTLDTGLNSLANNANSVASPTAINNATALELFVDFELVIATQGTARITGATIQIFMTQAVDDTNYGDTHESTAELVAVFPLDAATTARRAAVRDVPIPPGLFKFFLRNATGQALAASGNTLKYRVHSIAST